MARGGHEAGGYDVVPQLHSACDKILNIFGLQVGQFHRLGSPVVLAKNFCEFMKLQILLHHVFQCPLVAENATDAEAVLKIVRYW